VLLFSPRGKTIQRLFPNTSRWHIYNSQESLIITGVFEKSEPGYDISYFPSFEEL
jgi:hypothetical protein